MLPGERKDEALGPEAICCLVEQLGFSSFAYLIPRSLTTRVNVIVHVRGWKC